MVKMAAKRLVMLVIVGFLMASTIILLSKNSLAGSETIELTPTDDAYVDSDEPFNNYGTDISLDVFS